MGKLPPHVQKRKNMFVLHDLKTVPVLNMVIPECAPETHGRRVVHVFFSKSLDFMHLFLIYVKKYIHTGETSTAKYFKLFDVCALYRNYRKNSD